MGWGPSPFGWLPYGLNEETGFRLDIVSLLAVIGESSMAEQVQPLTASWLCLLPRLLPAPQVLLKPSRPFRMPDYKAKVVGVKNGTVVEALNYFPNIVHPLDKLEPFGFQVYDIRHKSKAYGDDDYDDDDEGQCVRRGHHHRLSVAKKFRPRCDVESAFSQPIRSGTMEREAQLAKVPTNAGDPMKKPLVPSAKYSPLKILDVASFILTLVILFFCVWNRDGIACMALGVLSIVSSVVGYASKWTPKLMNRSSTALAPRGDVMIRTREGGFILVLCKEEVARELYFGSEQCVYQVKSTVFYRFLVGTATFLLMSSVILLGNCKFIQQAAIGSAYIGLNFAYWMVSLVPKGRLWDLSHYECKNLTETDEDFKDFMKIQAKMNKTPAFTRTLWYAIYASQSTEWCKKTNATPNTDAWDQWLAEAEKHAKSGNMGWNPVKAINNLLEKYTIPHAPVLDYRESIRKCQDDREELDRLETQLKKQLRDIEGIRQRIGERIRHNGAQTWSS